MAETTSTGRATLTVEHGGVPGHAGSVREALTDGTFVIAVGVAMAAAFGPEAVKTFVTGEPAGRWWFIVLGAAAVGVVVGGMWLRRYARRRVRVGIVVIAGDSGGGAPQLDAQAERYCRQEFTVTLAARVTMSADAGPAAQVEELAEQVRNGIQMTDVLTPDATRIGLVPTMRLHAAFHLGAHLGHTFPREVVLHAVLQTKGERAYFPAVSLRAGRSEHQPLRVGAVELVDGGDPNRFALAVDLQGLGQSFLAGVRGACAEHGYGRLLLLDAPDGVLKPDQATFTGAVDQVVEAWRAVDIPHQARIAPRAIFPTGPVVIALALGARLAGADRKGWTAYTFDRTTSRYTALGDTPARDR